MYKQLLFFSFIISFSMHAMEINVLDLDYDLQVSDDQMEDWLDKEIARFEKNNRAQGNAQKPELIGKKIGATKQFPQSYYMTPFEETFGPMFAQMNPEHPCSRAHYCSTEILNQNNEAAADEEESNEQMLQHAVMGLKKPMKIKLSESEKSSPKPLKVKTPTGLVPLTAFKKEQMEAYAQRCEQYRKSLTRDLYDTLGIWLNEVIEKAPQNNP